MLLTILFNLTHLLAQPECTVGVCSNRHHLGLKEKGRETCRKSYVANQVGKSISCGMSGFGVAERWVQGRARWWAMSGLCTWWCPWSSDCPQAFVESWGGEWDWSFLCAMPQRAAVQQDIPPWSDSISFLGDRSDVRAQVLSWVGEKGLWPEEWVEIK